jgi:hypothetical protein
MQQNSPQFATNLCSAACSVWLEDPTAYEDPDGWVAGWTRLAAAIAKVRGGQQQLAAVLCCGVAAF